MCRWIPVVLLALLASASLRAVDPPEPVEPETEEVTLNEWLIGEHRDEVVDLLGKPSKKKKRRGGRVFIYTWDPSTTWTEVFPADSSHWLSVEPVPVAAAPQPSDLGFAPVRDLAPPSTPPDWWKPNEEMKPGAVGGPRKRDLTILEITFDAEDRVASCRVLPRKRKKDARRSGPE